MELRRHCSVYSPTGSPLGCRGAVQRQLFQDLKRRDINVFKDKELKGANVTLDGHLKDIKCKAQGCSVRQQLYLAYQVRGTVSDHVRLTEKVCFLISYHFFLRRRETQANLKKEDLHIQKNEAGHSYVTLSTSFANQNLQGGTSGSDEVRIGRIQQEEDQVRIMQLLLAKLPESCSQIFQMARREQSKTMNAGTRANHSEKKTRWP